MINKERIIRILTLCVAGTAFVVLGGVDEAYAQRDPFAKPAWARTRDTKPGVPGSGKYTGPPINLGTPGIQQRIDYYKRLREVAASNGQPIPKVTSVLTLDEMAVTGIFRTPRGYAAMVEATPIKLSYTIYPGERFFDGQLVAVEENRLVFRKVTKMSNGKFVSSVENKSLRKYTDREVVQGTAPTTSEGQQPDQSASSQAVPAAAPSTDPKAPVAPIVSPLEEMNRQVKTESVKEKDHKPARKPAKVARKN